MAHWAPGAILTLIALFYIADSNKVRFFWKLSSRLHSTTLLILTFGVVSFVVGQVLDAIRDGLFEDLADWVGGKLPAEGWFASVLRWLGIKKVKWDFFVTGDQRELDNLEVWFYSHYMLSFNLGLGMFLLPLCHWWQAFPDASPDVPYAIQVLLVVAGLVLFYDALRLRSHVADFTHKLGHTGT